MDVLMFLLLLVVACLFAVAIGMRAMGVKRLGTHHLHMPPNLPWALLIVTIAYNVFVHEAGFGIATGLFGAATLIALWFCFPRDRRSALVTFFTVVGIAAALSFGWRANGFVQIMNAIVVMGAVTTLCFLLSIDKPRWSALWFLKMKSLYLARLSLHLSVIAGNWSKIRSARGRIIFVIVRTVLTTGVLLLIFSYLLSAADPVFGQMIARIREQALGRTFASLGVACVLAFLTTLRLPADVQEKIPTFRIFSFIEFLVPVLCLTILFALFLGVQVRYLFGSHEDLATFGYTYSEYVRRGFIELLVTALLGSCISYALILKRQILARADHARMLGVLNAFLVLELAAMLASALKRDWMYMEIYGITRIRIVGLVFLAWLGGILALLLLFTLWSRMKEKLFIAGAAVLSMCALVYFNAYNMDDAIAAATPPRNQPKDIFYISLLSADAYEGWIEAATESVEFYESIRTLSSLNDEQTRRFADVLLAVAQLRNKKDALLKRQNGWRKYIFAERVAAQALQLDKVVAHLYDVELACLASSLQDFLSNRDVSVEQFIDWRMNYFSYPLTWGVTPPRLEADAGSLSFREVRTGLPPLPSCR